MPAPLIPPPTTNRSSGRVALPFMGPPIARLTPERADRKRPHGVSPQDRDLRGGGVRRLDRCAPLAWPVRRGAAPAGARAARTGPGATAARGRRGHPFVHGLWRLRVGQRGEMQPPGLPATLRAATLDRVGVGPYFAAPQKRP